MKEYSVTVGDRQYKIVVDRSGEKTFSVRVNEKHHEVAIEGLLSFNAPITVEIDGRPYKIGLSKTDRETYGVELEGKKTVVKVSSVGTKKEPARATPLLGRPTTKRPMKSDGQIEAPMPGRIVSVKVKTGDYVKVGDALLILEAMKMENEIMASREGTVKEVRVSEGASVGKGEVMVVVG